MTDIVARALALQKEKGVNQFKSIDDFPKQGNEGELYIDNTSNQIYYWNNDSLLYIPLMNGDQNPPIISDTIDGGTY